MTRAELNRYTRYLLDELGTNWLETESATTFDLNDALMDGYRRYARETRCFPVFYTAPATQDISIYFYSGFGTSSAGARIFAPKVVAYNSVRLTFATEAYLDGIDPSWRFADSGTPTHWLMWGDGKFRLYPTPEGAQDIYLEGYETPDPTGLDNDGDVPLIHEDDHRLIAVWACMLVLTRGAVADMAERAPALWQAWQDGIKAANDRLHNDTELSVTLGGMAGPMSRLELRRLTMFLLNQIGGDSGGVVYYDVNSALFAAYRKYAYETRCFRSSFSLAATVGKSTYTFADFGDAAKRIFEVTMVGYGTTALAQVDEGYLSGLNPHWQFAGNGIPTCFLPYGELQFRIYPTPSGTSSITLSGVVTPDPENFNADDDIPAIHEGDHWLIAVWAALLVATGGNQDIMKERAPKLLEYWNTGIVNALARNKMLPIPPKEIV